MGLSIKCQRKGKTHGVFGFASKRVQISTAFASVSLFAHMFSWSDMRIVFVENATEWQYSGDWLDMHV